MSEPEGFHFADTEPYWVRPVEGMTSSVPGGNYARRATYAWHE